MVEPKKRVMRLKVIAKLYSLSGQQITEGCDVKMHRNYIINGWNGKYAFAPAREESIQRFLRGEGIAEELVEGAFEIVNEAEETAKLMGGELPQPSNPDEKIETMGVVMLRKRVRDHFGLERDPFQPRAEDEPFKSAAFMDCLELVWDAIDNKAFLALSGPTGCGKSVLWMYLLRELQKTKYSSSVRVAAVRRFDKGRIGESDIMYSLLADLGEEDETLGRRVEAANRRVEDLLVEGTEDRVTTVILINEAHDLTHSGFVQLKRLWEMFGNRPKMGYARSCAVIMLGQEGLAGMLNSTRPELREVCQRADLERYGLLRPDEVGGYLRHRMGADCDRVFEKSAIEFFSSRQIRLTPQIVNVMATRAINDAYMINDDVVTAEIAGAILR